MSEMTAVKNTVKTTSGVLRPLSAELLQFAQQLYVDGLQWSTQTMTLNMLNWEYVFGAPNNVWMVYVKDQKAIGLAGFENIRPYDRIAEPYVAIVEAERRKGEGATMAEALRQYGVKHLNLRRIQTQVLAGSPSEKILQKLNFKKEGTAQAVRFKDGIYHDAAMYAWLAG